MLKTTKKLSKILIISGMMMSAQYSFAQEVQWPAQKPYSNFYLESRGCDYRVYDRMFEKAGNDFKAKQSTINDILVKKQLEASPKEATNKMLSCVDGAIRQLDGLVNNVMGIYNLITGAGNIDLAALGSRALNQLSQMACNAVNNYTSGAVYSSVQPYNSAMTSLPGQVSGSIGSVGTPVGNINLGQMTVDAARQQAGQQPNTSYVRDATNTTVNGITSGGALR